jgi:hypothetical protein
VVILFLVLLALSVGIVISSRYVRSLRSTIRMDSASRALASAEALAERILGVSYATLSGYIDNSNCTDDCTLTITYPDGQDATALATLSYMTSMSGPYLASVSEGEAYEVSLNGYAGGSLDICWDDGASIYAAYVYEDSGSYDMSVSSYNPTGSIEPNGFDVASGSGDYTSCFSISMDNTPELLRLRPYYDDLIVSIIPESGYDLPGQGIEITVMGTSGETSREVSLLKTRPMTPAIFDMVLFQRSLTDPLSNSGN